MKFNIVIILLTCFMISCQNSRGDKNRVNSTEQDKAMAETAFVPVKSFAVLWNWTEGNTIEGILPSIQQQAQVVVDLWEKGIIENAYMENESELNKNEKFANAFFIIKGKNEQEVRGILDKTPAYLAGITNYNLYPIGIKWLKRNKNAIQKAQESKKSFAVVWTQIEYNDKYEQYVGEQAIKILELWNEGVIENAYLDVEKVGKKDQQNPTLLFFINASTQEDAAKILDELPFVSEKIGKYSLYPVGSFWMSTPEEM